MQRQEEEVKKKKVLLIGWDGADWEHINPLIEEGLLPTLDGLINEGVMGNLATLQPVLSPMLWNSVATGKHAHKHGIHGFVEPTKNGKAVRPYSSGSRQTKALWNIFSQNGIRSNIVNWWASHPAEKIKGSVVSNLFNGVKFHPQKGWQISPGTIHPAEKEQAFAKFKIFGHELTEKHILPFIPDAAKIDQENDPRLETLARLLGETATTHSIATAMMETEPWEFMAIYYTGIDHFAHAFMNYHPPQMPNVSDADFEMYKDVMKGAYRFHDMMLDTLLKLAGEDTTVILCSDHGFQSGKFRPLGIPREPAGPAIWHRQYGMVVMKGEGIKKDERIYGASLIDIGPTILNMYGLPIGDDMDGRPIMDAFETPPEIKTIPSWDEVDGDGDHGFNVGEEEMDVEESNDLMDQFIALGYIEDQGDDIEKQVFGAGVELKYNLARNLMWQSKYDEALPVLEEIVRLAPWETRFIIHLADGYFHAGYLKQSLRLLETAFDMQTTNLPQVIVLHSRIKASLGEHQESLESLSRAVKLTPRDPSVHLQIAKQFCKKRHWEAAEKSCLAALKLHPENARALQVLASVYLRTGRNEEAADAALDSVMLLHRLPMSHFHLGVAMARLKDFDKSILAFNNALKFSPTMRNAHRWLARIYGAYKHDSRLAQLHTDQALLLATTQTQKKTESPDRTETLFDIPEFENEAARQERLFKERPRGSDSDNEKSGKTILLVSGLPRSGTSLMMQMLTAGGLKAMTDNERVADENNPRGYFEWEAIKQVKKNPEMLDDLEPDHVVKVISMLISSLPAKHDYKVVFMTRPVDEVAASQSSMIEKLGTKGANLEQDELERGLLAHRIQALQLLKKSKNVEYIEVVYPDLISESAATIEQLVEFIGTDLLTSPEKMATAIDEKLYRQRKQPATLKR